MEYDGAWVKKQLRRSDVQDRLAVPSDMLAIMPCADSERNIPIRVLDDLGHVYQFNLSARRGRYIKPVFQAREWGAFIKDRGAEVGDVIYFRREVTVNAEYSIVLLRNFLPPHPDL